MRTAAFALLTAGMLTSIVGQAETFSNFWGSSADFPAGIVSFADELVEFSPGVVPDPQGGPDIPLPEYRDGNNALGAPDMTLQQLVDCSAAASTETCRFVSLGIGGFLTVKFTDNLLTGSGNSDPDLYIFETGPIESTYVDVSVDGINWSSVGLWPSFANGVDIDAFGFGVNDTFAFLRLRDDPTSGNTSGITVGADIDAIGAISTTTVPLPGSGWLLVSAIGLFRWMRRQ